MINTIHSLIEFLKYQQIAKTKYYLHSPFVYQFYLQILEGVPDTEIRNITKLRNKLLHNHDKIVIEDLGSEPGRKERRISTLASKASIPSRYGEVMYRLVSHFKPNTVLELGTCLGLGTAYLSSAAPAASVTTIEGSRALAAQSVNNFAELGLSNISVVQGHFDDRLPEVLQSMAQVDMAFIDGNHRYEPTMNYFHQIMQKSHDHTILIFDDIYWSVEMTRAWEEIKKDPRITLTIDIYRLGIVFMQHDKLAKEDFILRY
ncbi:MAG: SAM-dependent methyltransferase [Bacteroidetes bacterium]|nr:SAM-dependent methyltransferase [Bacteroidota bacterium]